MSSHFSNSNKGFTLIEMLVVITIFIIMTGVILADFPGFRDKAGLDLIAQEIATTIRQAQVYGIGTREQWTGTSSTFPSHGVYFDLGATNGEKSFILYADDESSGAVNVGKYGAGDTTAETFVIQGSVKIVGLKKCDSSDSCTPLNPRTLDIFFQRFYPEAEFFDINGNEISSSYVKIVIQSTRDTTKQKEIKVFQSGQIVVANPVSP